MDYQDEYLKKLCSADEAVCTVKPGDRVCWVSVGVGPKQLLRSLARRADELKDIELVVFYEDEYDGLFQKGTEKAFRVKGESMLGPLMRQVYLEGRLDFVPILFSQRFKLDRERPPDAQTIDVFMVVVSPPDEKGFCSFGQVAFHKQSFARNAKRVIAEVDANQIRTYGDNSIHISEIDNFVEYTPPELPRIMPATKPAAELMPIGDHVASLVRDGDTIQVGSWTFMGGFLEAGMLDRKNDLGIHCELMQPGMIRLVKEGVATGKYKTVNRDKAVCTSFFRFSAPWERAFVANNPAFEVYDATYTNDVKVIAAHKNFVSINAALAVDLFGQITADTAFGILYNGAGGLPEFVIGSLWSDGGRSIIALPSTAKGGTVSRIVPTLPDGSLVTIPSTLADYVVTEYGVAKLFGTSMKERAEALINIAHPNFRAELRKAVQRS